MIAIEIRLYQISSFVEYQKNGSQPREKLHLCFSNWNPSLFFSGVTGNPSAEVKTSQFFVGTLDSLRAPTTRCGAKTRKPRELP